MVFVFLHSVKPAKETDYICTDAEKGDGVCLLQMYTLMCPDPLHWIKNVSEQ